MVARATFGGWEREGAATGYGLHRVFHRVEILNWSHAKVAKVATRSRRSPIVRLTIFTRVAYSRAARQKAIYHLAFAMLNHA